MIDSLSYYIRTPQNENACAAIDKLNGASATPIKVIIKGPHYSGKSALVRGVGEDAIRNGAEMMLFTCSGFDIAMALAQEADDSFFERLGETPSLIIDDIAGLKKVDKGDHLLKLLIEERNRLGLSTAITTTEDITEADFPLSAEPLSKFEIIEIQPIDNDGRARFVKMVENAKRKENSPRLATETVDYIANEFAKSFFDMEAATRYFMEDKDCAKFTEIDINTARKLLEK